MYLRVISYPQYFKKTLNFLKKHQDSRDEQNDFKTLVSKYLANVDIDISSVKASSH